MVLTKIFNGPSSLKAHRYYNLKNKTNHRQVRHCAYATIELKIQRSVLAPIKPDASTIGSTYFFSQLTLFYIQSYISSRKLSRKFSSPYNSLKSTLKLQQFVIDISQKVRVADGQYRLPFLMQVAADAARYFSRYIGILGPQ